MTPEELGRIAFATCLGPDDAGRPWSVWEMQPDHVQLTWVNAALAVAAAVKREDAGICEKLAETGALQPDGKTATASPQYCARAILASIAEPIRHTPGMPESGKEADNDATA